MMLRGYDIFITTGITVVDFGDIEMSVYEHLSSEALAFGGRPKADTWVYKPTTQWLLNLFGKTEIYTRSLDRVKFEFNNEESATRFKAYALTLYPEVSNVA